MHHSCQTKNIFRRCKTKGWRNRDFLMLQNNVSFCKRVCDFETGPSTKNWSKLEHRLPACVTGRMPVLQKYGQDGRTPMLRNPPFRPDPEHRRVLFRKKRVLSKDFRPPSASGNVYWLNSPPKVQHEIESAGCLLEEEFYNSCQTLQKRQSEPSADKDVL